MKWSGKMPKKLIIFGLGETAHLAYEYLTHDSDYDVICFCVDPQYIEKSSFCGLPVISTHDIIEHYPTDTHHAFAAAGSGHLNRDRAALYNKAKSLGYKMASYISSRAFIWHNAAIGENCFILEDNTLQPFTEIGNNVVLWSGNHIGHRTAIEDHCFITSHCVISGYCKIGSHTFMGVNTTVADHITIENDNFIGMGTVVRKNTEKDGFYNGHPAEKRKISAKRFCKVREET